MFRGCVSLRRVNISNFNTKSLKYIGFMFRDCKELRSLNMRNFHNTVLRAQTFLTNAYNLKFLDLGNLRSSKSNYVKYFSILDNCTIDTVDLSGFSYSALLDNITDCKIEILKLGYINAQPPFFSEIGLLLVKYNEAQKSWYNSVIDYNPDVFNLPNEIRGKLAKRLLVGRQEPYIVAYKGE